MTGVLPTEGKVVVIRPDTDHGSRNQIEALGIPVIVSPAVPEGMMFVVDLDKLHGRDPKAVRTMREAETMLARMSELVEKGEIASVKDIGCDAGV